VARAAAPLGVDLDADHADLAVSTIAWLRRVLANPEIAVLSHHREANHPVLAEGGVALRDGHYLGCKLEMLHKRGLLQGRVTPMLCGGLAAPARRIGRNLPATESPAEPNFTLLPTVCSRPRAA
jgi:hypothetical protein